MEHTGLQCFNENIYGTVSAKNKMSPFYYYHFKNKNASCLNRYIFRTLNAIWTSYFQQFILHHLGSRTHLLHAKRPMYQSQQQPIPGRVGRNRMSQYIQAQHLAYNIFLTFYPCQNIITKCILYASYIRLLTA